MFSRPARTKSMRFSRVRYSSQHPPVTCLEEDCSISMSREGCQLLISGGTRPELSKLGLRAGENLPVVVSLSLSVGKLSCSHLRNIFSAVFFKSWHCSNLSVFPHLNVRRSRKVQVGHYLSISGLAGSDLWTIDHEDVTGGVGSISLPSQSHSTLSHWNVNIRPPATRPDLTCSLSAD